MRTLAIGDIHGCLRSLEELVEFAEISSDDEIVTLGDYVDRGPDSKGVIDFLIELDRTHKLVHLRGNHELMMVESKMSRMERMRWVRVGGKETLESYATDSLFEIPLAHWDFIDSAHAFYETESHFFVHANADPDVPLDGQTESMLYWEPFIDPPPHQSGKIMVCGHTSQPSGLPRNLGHAICIDTSACRGEWLTCLDTGSGTYWQTNEDGERRMDNIAALLE